MKWLNKVAEYHEDYVKIVRNWGEDIYAEDIVQEMYLRLHKYGDPNKIILKNGEINKPYIYIVLRNIFKYICIQKQKHPKMSLDKVKHIAIEFDYISRPEAQGLLEAKINKEMDSWHWYDSQMFNYYRDHGWSLREASNKTGIGTGSIHRTIKYCKERLKENVGEDYEDYMNEDYELI